MESYDTAIVWHNGRLLPAGDVRVSPFDQGLTIGLGAFETLVAIGGRPFAYSRHWERLRHSAAGLAIPLPEREAVRGGLDAVIAANRLPEARLRITLTPGAGPPGSDRLATPRANCLVTASPRPSWPASARVAIMEWPRSDRSPLTGLKSTSYAENSLALADARRRGADEAVFANLSGNLCEGSGSNVFLVVKGTLYTPPLAAGCLAGVSRALVLEVARHLNLPLAESDLPLAALAAADEAFLTSTTRDVQPISHVDETALPAAPGPVTRRLQLAWQSLLAAGNLDP